MRSIVSTGVLCLAAFLGGASQVNAQMLVVESSYGARCAISTEGRQFGEFVMSDRPSRPSMYSLHIVHNWPEHLGDTITVTCSKQGFETKTMTFSKVPAHWMSMGAPCGVEDNRPIEPQMTYCLNYNELHKNDNLRPPAMEFPRLIVPLAPVPN